MKERFAALLTDALRSLLLTASGYSCTVMEFTDAESTEKNILIKAVKNRSETAGTAKTALEEYRVLCREYSVSPTLGRLLKIQ